jgi:hypothetical protein
MLQKALSVNSDFSNELGSADGAVSTLRNKDRRDKVFVISALVFFFAVVLYIIKRRIGLPFIDL